MPLPVKITSAIIGFIVLMSFLLNLGSGIYLENIIATYGALGVLSGALCALTAIIIFATDKKNYGWAQGFLLSAGLLLLTGFFALSQISFGR